MTLPFRVSLAALTCMLCTYAQSPSINNATLSHFTYRETDFETSMFAPKDWSMVSCGNVATCPGWPTNWEKYNPFIPYEGSNNKCLNCDNNSSGSCQLHKQSPIHLLRNVTAVKTCIDLHKMHYTKGDCLFEKMEFRIMPHVLRVNQPACQWQPDIDFSRGFPVRWKLAFTEISVPSQHTQDGKRYDAEVILSHIYEVNDIDKLIANVAILLEVGNETDKYDFLDLYISEWQLQAEQTQRNCTQRSLLGINVSNVVPSPQFLRRPEFKRLWNPYDWLDKVGTEYYFRYEGSTLVPPCFETVHWRVLKDSIKVAPYQLQALELLIAKRINPDTCEYDTVGKQRGDDWRVNVNRPTQTTSKAHNLVFCECVNWKSRTPNDSKYCELTTTERGVYNNTPSQ